jgi:bacterioferritin
MTPQIDPSEQVLESLQEALKAELTAIHQYLLHSKVCQNWGYRQLAESNRKECLEELAHAEALIDRILFLNATPNMTELSPIRFCSDVKEQFESDLALEKEAVARLNDAVKAAQEANDNVSRALFDRILADEDQHVEHLESQLHAIGEIGIANYLARQL